MKRYWALVDTGENIYGVWENKPLIEVFAEIFKRKIDDKQLNRFYKTGEAVNFVLDFNHRYYKLIKINEGIYKQI
jgi:hypothetical protein